MSDTTSSPSPKTVKLEGSDKVEFVVEEYVAKHCPRIRKLIEKEDFGDNKPILIPDATSEILSKVMEYCKKHVEAGTDNAPDSLIKPLADADGPLPDLYNVLQKCWMQCRHADTATTLIDKAAGLTKVVVTLTDTDKAYSDLASAMEGWLSSTKEELDVWDAQFVKGLELNTLCHLISVADYLHIPSLIDFDCPTCDSNSQRQEEEQRQKLV